MFELCTEIDVLLLILLLLITIIITIIIITIIIIIISATTLYLTITHNIYICKRRKTRGLP